MVLSKETDMTMPEQRARALRFAGEILREIGSRTDVPVDLQKQAQFILRHYPDSQDLKQMISDTHRLPRELLDQQWLAPEDAYQRDAAC